VANEFKGIKVTISVGLREAGVSHSIGADVALPARTTSCR
jgi:hypothetical protein